MKITSFYEKKKYIYIYFFFQKRLKAHVTSFGFFMQLLELQAKNNVEFFLMFYIYNLIMKK